MRALAVSILCLSLSRALGVTCGDLKSAFKQSKCCGADGSRTASVHPCGSAENKCRCLGEELEDHSEGFALSLLGQITGNRFTRAWSEYMMKKGYTSDYGLACGAHDSKQPYCQAGGKNASDPWCSQSWCYMSASGCPNTSRTGIFGGTPLEPYLYYSYHVCGGAVHFPRGGRPEDRRLEDEGIDLRDDDKDNTARGLSQNQVQKWQNQKKYQMSCDRLKDFYKRSECCGANADTEAAASPCGGECECLGNAFQASSGGLAYSLYSLLLNTTWEQAWAYYMTVRGYTADYGLNCGAHDAPGAYCQARGRNASAQWCPEEWCYMTNLSCSTTHKSHFFNGTELEDFLFYSYPHCKGTDYFPKNLGRPDSTLKGAASADVTLEFPSEIADFFRGMRTCIPDPTEAVPAGRLLSHNHRHNEESLPVGPWNATVDWSPHLPEIPTRRKLAEDHRENLPQVQDQHLCGSCYAFAVVASIEAVLSINGIRPNNKVIKLSERHLALCFRRVEWELTVIETPYSWWKEDERNGCKGGNPKKAFMAIAQQGLILDGLYPYPDMKGTEDIENVFKFSRDIIDEDTCEVLENFPIVTFGDPNARMNLDPPRTSGFHVIEWFTLVEGFQKLTQVLQYQPVVVSISTSSSTALSGHFFQNFDYLDEENCPSQPTSHAVLLAGYTKQSWLLRNSWGLDAHDEGYLKLERGTLTDPKNPCSILMEPGVESMQAVYPPRQTNLNVDEDELKEQLGFAADLEGRHWARVGLEALEWLRRRMKRGEGRQLPDAKQHFVFRWNFR